MKFQIVIPMSGYGERFRRAGYDVPKPLIEVDGLPIIAHVVNMFPGETDFVFICNEEHLDTPHFRMAATLEEHCPTGRIVGISPHKLGPVYAVAQIFDQIADDKPIILNYCDFTCYWDYAHFQDFVTACDCDGAIPAYRGFHPHSQGSTFYAYLRECDGWASDIQEKQPFTDTPKNEYASSGTYYFKSGSLMRTYLQRALDEELTTGGEYYISLAYKPMFHDRRRVAVYPLQHFMQWGTPEDLSEYNSWSKAFRQSVTSDLTQKASPTGSNLIPLAGAGSRFTKEGYKLPKPLIEVSGKPMVVQAANALPHANVENFVLRRDLPNLEQIEKAITEYFPGSHQHMLDGLTDGQARTCYLAAKSLPPDSPLTIGACDNGMLYDADKFHRLLENDGADVIAWVARGHAAAARHPEMYGWVRAEDDRVLGVSVKKPLQDPTSDPIIVGSFTFRKTRYFLECAERLFAREDGKVNGEYYLDSCLSDAIALGFDCRIFEIDSYICWGTPDELRTFEYWQSCFHKWPYHPYRLELDPSVSQSAISRLENAYKATVPTLPS